MATTIVAIDQRGHGKSDHAYPYDFGKYVMDLYCVVEQLEWKTFSLLGHSMGAAVTLLYSGCFPNNVARLICLDGLGPLSISGNPPSTQMRNAILAHFKPSPHPLSMAFAIDQQRPVSQPRVFDSLEDAAQRRMEGAFDPVRNGV